MEVYKNITEMRQYLYTSFTNNLGSILCDYNSTDRKVFDASYIISLDSGNFLSGFASGAASSGMGSYAQSIKVLDKRNYAMLYELATVKTCFPLSYFRFD